MFEGLFQPMHLLVILVIALLVFGPKKLPELGKSIGEGIRALRSGLQDSSPESKDKEPKKNSGDADSHGAPPPPENP
jgi:sec-independent protein translocase protein TatA